MTQEEKLKEAQRLYETANADQRYVLESLFPELRESEDERIRKWLLDFVQGLPDEGLDFHFYNLNKEQVVAWLERQAQMPAWSEEDDRMCKAIINNIKTICKEGYFVGNIDNGELINWLKDLRYRLQWKPSDEQMDALLVKIPIKNSCNKVDNILKSLYSDLKKLK